MSSAACPQVSNMSKADLTSVAGSVADAAVKAGGNNAQARVWCGCCHDGARGSRRHLRDSREPQLLPRAVQ